MTVGTLGRWAVNVNFNSHARVGRDLRIHGRSTDGDYFNSHARVGRDLGDTAAAASCSNFNSHARVGRDHGRYLLFLGYEISTHTPV